MDSIEDKKWIIWLLTMPKKKMLKLDEQELMSIIEQVDQIWIESVKDWRFLDAENSK